MIYLLLSIACSTIIILCFKAFERFGIKTFHAIVINYITCVLVGLPVTDTNETFTQFWAQPWFPWALFMGGMFIFLFYLIGRTAQTSGVAAASVSMKLAFVLPILLAFFVYGEEATLLKVLGIACAFAAVVFTSIKPRRKTAATSHSTVLDSPIPPQDKQSGTGHGAIVLILPLIVFIGSGITDSIVQYTKRSFFQAGGMEGFTIFLFGTAAVIGSIVLIIDMLRGNKGPNWKALLGGIVLGIPNYGSIYFFFKTLIETGWEDSVVFPINNIGIVTTAALLAWVIFKERLTTLNLVGLGFAILSIVLIGFLA